MFANKNELSKLFKNSYPILKRDTTLTCTRLQGGDYPYQAGERRKRE
jgi:hypothetical protein